jgi:PKD repeat protein
MTAEMIVKQVAITNIEVVFEPKVLAPSGEVIRRGKFAWNFGDGASVVKETNEKVVHTYKKSGDYVVTLDYFMNPYIASTTSDAGDRVILTVEDHKLAITSFDEAGNVTLHNADTKEFDLSGWSLSLGSKQFAFAYNSIILPGKSLFLAASVTGFAGADHTLPLMLVGKDGTIAFTFNNARSSAARVSSRALSSSSLPLPTEIPEEQKTEITPAIPLSAQAVDTQSDETRGSSATISIVTLAIMLALSIGITLYIRRRKRGEPENADDIAIVD